MTWGVLKEAGASLDPPWQCSPERGRQQKYGDSNEVLLGHLADGCLLEPWRHACSAANQRHHPTSRQTAPAPIDGRGSTPCQVPTTVSTFLLLHGQSLTYRFSPNLELAHQHHQQCILGVQEERERSLCALPSLALVMGQEFSSVK